MRTLLSQLIFVGALALFSAIAARAATSASAQAPASTKVLLRVEGMHCATCPLTVRTVLRRLEGVRDATVSARAKTASVTYNPVRITPNRIAQAVTDAGYPAQVQP